MGCVISNKENTHTHKHSPFKNITFGEYSWQGNSAQDNNAKWEKHCVRNIIIKLCSINFAKKIFDVDI